MVGPTLIGVSPPAHPLRGYLDFEMLGDRLPPLGAVVGDAAQDVGSGMYPAAQPRGDVVADGSVAVDGPPAPVLRGWSADRRLTCDSAMPRLTGGAR